MDVAARSFLVASTSSSFNLRLQKTLSRGNFSGNSTREGLCFENKLNEGSLIGRYVFCKKACSSRSDSQDGSGEVASHQSSGHCEGENFPEQTSFYPVQEEFSKILSRFVSRRQACPQPERPTKTKFAFNNLSRKNWRVKGFLLALPAVAGLNLEGPQSVLQALGVLALIITVHECGHFLAARLQKIHVSQFSIGFGPKLAKIQGNSVEYSIRAIPFGGFVGFPDDDPDSEFSPDDPDLLKNRPISDRAIVVSAGVVANIVLAYTVLFTQVLTVGILEQEFFPGVVVPDVVRSSAAERAGVRPGDVIVSVDGRSFSASQGSVFQLVDTIKRSPGRKLSFLVMRGGDALNLKVSPDENFDGSGKIGVQLAPNSRPHRVKARDLAEATVQASSEFWRLTGTVLDGLRQVVFNFAQTADKLSGPVAIVAVGAEVARSDAAGLFQFAAIVNINLAVVNLLPLPALDGGYLALIALEAARGGKKLPTKLEQGIMSSGVLLLFALGFALMVRDTLNLGIVRERL
ncbi:hypothetical protein O6H91_17G044700 [Diphasiastrum complanatum]|nr:hypothetical protein O6H91_17G044700 [Diphasiastrum complanatum]